MIRTCWKEIKDGNFFKITNGFNRLKLNDVNYFFEQFQYGGREILLSYVSQSNPVISSKSYLAAGLSHGWQPDEQLWKLWNRNLTRAPRYVWNDRFELTARANSRAVAIGSSWLYLLKSLNIKPNQEVKLLGGIQSNKYLLMLTHNVVPMQKRIDLQAQFYSEICDPKETTVCLFWIDFCNPQIYQSFEKLGYSLVCAGDPDQFILNKVQQGRTNFLVNILEIIASHDIYVTDECTTSTFYAGSLGKDIIIKTDKVGLEFQDSWAEKYSSDGVKFFNRSENWLRHNFPSFFQKIIHDPN